MRVWSNVWLERKSHSQSLHLYYQESLDPRGSERQRARLEMNLTTMAGTCCTDDQVCYAITALWFSPEISDSHWSAHGNLCYFSIRHTGLGWAQFSSSVLGLRSDVTHWFGVRDTSYWYQQALPFVLYVSRCCVRSWMRMSFKWTRCSNLFTFICRIYTWTDVFKNGDNVSDDLVNVVQICCTSVFILLLPSHADVVEGEEKCCIRWADTDSPAAADTATHTHTCTTLYFCLYKDIHRHNPNSLT